MTVPDVPQDLGALAEPLHNTQIIHAHRFFPVSIFHCSFHPTKGNVIDWALKAEEGWSFLQSCTGMIAQWSPDLDLANVEFSSLPSGLHLVEEDVVYARSSPLRDLFLKVFQTIF